MTTTITNPEVFYPPAPYSQTSTIGSPILRDNENASTNRMRFNFYNDMIDKQKKMMNKQKIKSFKELQSNWNYCHAAPFEDELILKAEKLISMIWKQPDVFPTGRESIQFEYEKENGDYLEFEVFSDRINKLFMDDAENEEEEVISIDDISKINNILREFYERSHS